MPPSLRLATFAVPLSGNKGSASMLLGLMDSFQRRGIECAWDVFSYYPERDREIAAEWPHCRVFAGHPKDLAFRLLPAQVLGGAARPFLPKSSEAARALATCDGVLAVGGTTFADSMLYKCPWNVLAALPGFIAKKPVCFLSQTIGPFEHPLNRLSARWTLHKAACVHGRGRTSTNWAHKLDLPDAVYEPDLSFGMEVPAFADVAAKEPTLKAFADAVRQSGRLPVGVAPNSIVLEKAAKRGTDYITFLASCIRSLHEQGFFPVLIPHSYRPAESGQHNNDRHLCNEVVQRLEGAVPLHFLDADLDSRALRSLIGQLHFLVASRFHSMISALSQEVPPLTFGWGGHKYREVLAEFGLEANYVDFSELETTPIEETLRRFAEQREVIAQQISAALPPISADAEAIPDRILEVLGHSGNAGK